MNTEKILAIDPGTRKLGVAILKGEELLYYGVKSLRTAPMISAPAGAVRLLRKLTAEYQPTSVALKQSLIIQHSAEQLAIVIRELKREAGEEGLHLYVYAPKTIRQRICGAGAATKRETITRLVARYPELAQYASKKSEWEELYYARMFDAIAVGLACHYDLEEAQSGLC